MAGVVVSEEEAAAEGVEDLEVCSNYVKFVVRACLMNSKKLKWNYKSLGC